MFRSAPQAAADHPIPRPNASRHRSPFRLSILQADSSPRPVNPNDLPPRPGPSSYSTTATVGNVADTHPLSTTRQPTTVDAPSFAALPLSTTRRAHPVNRLPIGQRLSTMWTKRRQKEKHQQSHDVCQGPEQRPHQDMAMLFLRQPARQKRTGQRRDNSHNPAFGSEPLIRTCCTRSKTSKIPAQSVQPHGRMPWDHGAWVGRQYRMCSRYTSIAKRKSS